jgi:GMP synthase (glutamine-hydrolysing)
VVEPLRDLYKTEVRELGRALGLDPASVERHPFPGPGLGIRVAASGPTPVDFEEQRLLRELPAALSGAGLTGLPLPVRSVGVKADLRSYEHPVLLVGPDPGWERLTGIATSLTKQVHGINRCLYDLTGRRLGKVELVAATVTRERLDLLRELDALVMAGLARHDLMKTVWQCPTVLVPVRIDGRGSELVVIRPVHSERAMTARPAWVGEAFVRDVVPALLKFPEVGSVAIDITTKPPATIEWE